VAFLSGHGRPGGRQRVLVHGALLHVPFRGETEAGLRRVYGSEHLSGKILAHGRTMLESVTGSSTGQPDVFHLRMAIQQKVPVGAVFVLANAGLDLLWESEYLALIEVSNWYSA